MNTSLFKLQNTIKNYDWGCKTGLTDLLDIPNPENSPQAEIWMGTHPNGCSKEQATGMLLSDLINKNTIKWLGQYTVEKYGELPFLFKVICAFQPLSIQVHPNLKNAIAGFTKENEKGIPRNAHHRDYKDSNHKPEMLYALTNFKVMNGFRPIEQIIYLFDNIKINSLESEVTRLIQSHKAHKDEMALQQFFSGLLSIDIERKEIVLAELIEVIDRYDGNDYLLREVISYVRQIHKFYKDDIGLLAPLILNTFELKAGDAIFLYAETPHAYIQGTALEVMANSDNVLRAGLTSKHINVTELLKNTSFHPLSLNESKIQPIKRENTYYYPVPVNDFSFAIVPVTEVKQMHYLRSAEIIFCISGEVTIATDDKTLTLNKGESAFIGYFARRYQYWGNGKLSRAFN